LEYKGETEMDIKGTVFNDNDTVQWGILRPSLVGTNTSDSIYGKTGNDILSGLDGNDYLYGEAGNDNLYGGNGNDYLNGGLDNDNLYGGNNNDILEGDMGNDKLDGQAGDDQLFGGEGNDLLIGGIGKDYLEGCYYGNNKNDLDTLTGGTEADKFVLGNDFDVYYLGNGHATITDFSLLQADKIQIKGKFADGYSLQLGNWGGAATQDTGIFFKGNLIGAVQDQNIATINPNWGFISAPPIVPG
jgi:Ca2+-binding RTX toxin-like protein